MIRPAALVIGFGLTLLAGKAANIVAGSGLKPTVGAAPTGTATAQLLPPRATTRDGGFSSLSSGGPAANAVGLLSPAGEICPAVSSSARMAYGLPLLVEAGAKAGEQVDCKSTDTPRLVNAGRGSLVGAGDWRQASRSRIARIPGMEEALARDLQDAGAASAKTGSPDRLIAGSRCGTNRPESGSTPERSILIEAIIAVESNGRADAVGDGGRAVGILQIHACVIDDVNHLILRRNAYTLADRTDPVKSREIFRLYIDYWCYGWRDEDVARTWNGGPCGAMRDSTVGYWHKVKRAMEEQR